MRQVSSRSTLLLALGLVAGGAFAACGSDESAANNPGGFTTDASADRPSNDGAGDGAKTDSLFLDQSSGDGSGCKTGEACGDGGICAGGTCCEAAHACGQACCAGDEICSFGKCVVPGKICSQTGDCAEGEYCEYALGEEPDGGTPDADTPEAGADSGTCVGGSKIAQGKCLPNPPVCAEGDAGASDAGTIECLQKCEYHPAAPDFSPVLKYSWGGMTTTPWDSDVMMAPIVIQLDDDDCDGKVTANDIPEILFTTHSAGQYTSPGPLHAISILQGKVVDKWTFPGIQPSAQLAAGNIDGNPGNEVVACTHDGSVQALSGDGKALWKTAVSACFEPAIADLDSDGSVEIIVEAGVLDGKTGAVKATFTPAMDGTFLVSDLDGDGMLDIVTGTQAYHSDGTQFVNTGVTGVNYTGSAYFKSGPAIADLDKDGVPEVIAVYFLTHQVAVWHYDAAEAGHFKFIRTGIDINGVLDPALCPAGSSGSKWGGGPATVGDFNADGYPDVALAGGVGYSVFDGTKLMNASVADASTFLWAKQTHDCSSSGTGSSLFDFNGDGRSEVIYSDEYYLRIYEGDTGEVLFETCNTTHTLNEYPVIADVDNDGQADIVVVSNAHNQNITCEGTQQSGVRIFASASGAWVRTRRVWNEHAYHITNVEEDGTIPKGEPANFKQAGLNNFRLNKQPGGEFSAPDAVVTVSLLCPGPHAVVATVRNMGQAALPAGLKVSFHSGNPPGGALLGAGVTTQTLYPAQAEQVVLALPNPPADIASGKTPVYASVESPTVVHECRPDNNTSAPVKAQCSGTPR
ncbi:MAG: VCBS repeat-containing protein [Deltaproteobacteria bacterium]|nr:VCBS repeat-containing protein [Deltaproteobacteria bacterium]